jgi:hypothetical protein
MLLKKTDYYKAVPKIIVSMLLLGMYSYKQFLMYLQANTEKSNKILVLQLGNQNKLIFQLLVFLDLNSVRASSLQFLGHQEGHPA